MPKDYTIQQGDTLGALADKAGTTARQIAQQLQQVTRRT